MSDYLPQYDAKGENVSLQRKQCCSWTPMQSCVLLLQLRRSSGAKQSRPEKAFLEVVVIFRNTNHTVYDN